MDKGRRSAFPMGDPGPPGKPLQRGVVGNRSTPTSRGSSATSLSVAFDLNDFKGAFSFDDFFNGLVGDMLPPPPGDEYDSPAATPTGGGTAAAGTPRGGAPPPGPAVGFAEAEFLLPLLRDARRDLIDLSRQVDSRLAKQRQQVAAQDTEHRQTLAELERGVEGLFDSFGRLDARISGVGQTAARIGDHLQSADAQRETASQTIDFIKYLMDFNSSRGDLLQYSPPAAVFSDDKRMGEAATIACKLRSFVEEDEQKHDLPNGGGSGVSPGLQVAAANLQEYCNDLENKLLTKFDAAAARRDKFTMSDCAKILEQFQRGSSAMHRYIASRKMFFDVEVMNDDIRIALGDPNALSLSPARGLPILYKEIVDTVREEAATVAAVFPSPKTVMSLLVQRVMEQRVFNVLDHILIVPSLDEPPPVEDGGLLAYLRPLAATFEKTMDLARELQMIGCGELDVTGLAQSLLSAHTEMYPEVEQASLMQLFDAKFLEVSHTTPEPGGMLGPRSRTGSSGMGIVVAVGVVQECIRWNEEAVARSRLLTTEAVPLAENLMMVFGILLDQVSKYSLLLLNKAARALAEATAQRDKVSIGTAVTRRLAAAVAAAAEQAAVAGEQGIRTFMNAVKRAASNVALVQQHFLSTIAPLLLPVDGAHARCIEDLAAKMSEPEAVARRGLRTCLDTALAEVERILSVEQKATDFRPDDGAPTDHRPTRTCIQVVAYLERVADMAHSSLEGPNRQAFCAELGSSLHRALLNHIQHFTLSPSGGLRLKRDVSEYADFARTFKAPVVDEKFESLGTVVNLFIVAPENIPSLVETSRLSDKEVQGYIALRDDYKTSKSSVFRTAVAAN